MVMGRTGKVEEAGGTGGSVGNAVGAKVGAPLMKISSSVTHGSRAAAKHLGKTPNRFYFDLLVEKVDSVSARGDVVLIIQRGSDVLSTSAEKANKEDMSVTFESKLGKEVTLFRSGDDGDFQEKLFKVALKSGSAKGKTIGKARLDLSVYAEVPSGTRRISCKLSNGSAVVITINSSFLGVGKKTSSAGTASYVSDSEVDVDEQVDLDGIEDDLDPLDFGDDELSIKPASGGAAVGGGMGMGGDCLQLRRNLDKLELKRKELERENLNLKKEISENSASGRGAGGKTFGALGFGARGKRGTTPATGAGGTGGPVNPELTGENERLKAELKDMEERMGREPQQTEMMDDLRKAKAALVQVSVQKEAAETELRALRARGRRKKRT